MSIAITSAVGGSLASALATAIGANAVVEIRSGAAPGPGNPAGGTLLVSVPLTGSFTPSSNAINGPNPGSVSPTAAGTAGHFRLKTSGGTAILEGTVTGSGGGGDLELTTTSIVMGVPVDLAAPTFTVPLV
jgi:hypothetical protein